MVGRRSSARIATIAVGVAAVLGALPALPALGTASAYAATSKNLIKNGTAEAGEGSADGSTVPVPDWTMKKGTTFTAVQYGPGGGFPTATDPGPKRRGLNFFAGGQSDVSNTIVATQTDSLKAYATAIAGGAVTFKLSGFLGGYSTQKDRATVELAFKDAHGMILSTAAIGPVTVAKRKGLTGLLARSATGSVPVGAVKVQVTLRFVRVSGSYNDGYADNLSLTLSGV
jgi:hypothetical protein